MNDTLMDERRFRLFNVVEDFNQEALAVEVDLNIPRHRVVHVLARLSAGRGIWRLSEAMMDRNLPPQHYQNGQSTMK